MKKVSLFTTAILLLASSSALAAKPVTRAPNRAGQNRTVDETRKKLKAVKTTRAPKATKTARAFSRLHPSISQQKQESTFGTLFAKADEVLARGEVPVIQLDLDLTTMLPTYRTTEALKDYGRSYDIPELRDDAAIARLAELPGYTSEAYVAWLNNPNLTAEGISLAQKYPRFASTRLQMGGYWSRDVGTDTAVPGLADFVAKFEARGGKVVFVSGRDSGMRQSTITSLQRAGVENPILLIGQLGGGDAETKRQRQGEIATNYGTTIAVVDDRDSNRAAVLGGNSHEVMSIGVAIPGYSHDPVTPNSRFAISTFETE